MSTPAPPTPKRPHVFVIRLSGELSIKAKGTRHRFTDRLVENLRDALRSSGIDFELRRTWSRLFVTASSAETPEVMQRVFGINSISPIEHRTWSDLDALVDLGEEIFSPHLEGKTFAVKARRLERQSISFQSADLERALGTRLLPFSAGVDLSDPGETLSVDLYESDAYFYREKIRCHGGLPLGQGGRALALVSGGFDSIVAAWLLMRRGVTLDFIFCNLGGAPHRDGTMRAIQVLADRWCYGTHPRLHMIDFNPLVEELEARCPAQLWQVVLKRQMLRAADRIAHIHGATAILTGESVGQVSSQTLQNLAVISQATELPILRPLCGSNKEEIFTYARRIGSFELSSKVPEYCALTRKQPATHASFKSVQEAEGKLELDRVVRQVDSRVILDLRKLDLDKIESASCAVDRVPEGATVVDLRSPNAYAAWHYPNAIRLDYFEALQARTSFEPGRTYVFYCEIGIKSAHLAEMLREADFDAYHVQDGIKTLRKELESRDEALRAALSPALLD